MKEPDTGREVAVGVVVRRVGAIDWDTVKALLLENIHPEAERILTEKGIEVETRKGALDTAELVEALEGVELLGIRSKTHVGREVFDAHPQLLSVGAFCIGTNQID